MREIKFRVWHQKSGCMSDPFRMFGEVFFTIGPKFPMRPIKSDELEIEQFTGLHDKNGREIYEGDIVARYNKHDLDEKPFRMEVYWNQPVCRWALRDDIHRMLMSDLCILEVIGDIHDNPELLK